MKLKRINAYIHTFYGNTTVEEQYIEGGKYVEWTSELQEACDNYQEIEVKHPFKYESSSTLNPTPSGYCSGCNQMLHKDKHKYCPNCGQKIKW